jgi:aspartate carbamoyltransferase catalytic subunit
MKRYEGVHFVLISPAELRLPDYMKHELGDNYSEYATIEEAMPLLDVLYMTRVQQERFDDPAEYERLKDAFILDTEKMALAKENMIVLKCCSIWLIGHACSGKWRSIIQKVFLIRTKR